MTKCMAVAGDDFLDQVCKALNLDTNLVSSIEIHLAAGEPVKVIVEMFEYGEKVNNIDFGLLRNAEIEIHTTLVSESSLAKVWDTPVEDDAWACL